MTREMMTGDIVTGEVRKRWMEFCEKAAAEQDPDKLMAVAEEINRLLQEKAERLQRLHPAPGSRTH